MNETKIILFITLVKCRFMSNIKTETAFTLLYVIILSKNIDITFVQFSDISVFKYFYILPHLLNS